MTCRPGWVTRSYSAHTLEAVDRTDFHALQLGPRPQLPQQRHLRHADRSPFCFLSPGSKYFSAEAVQRPYVLQEVWQHAWAPPAPPHLRIVGRDDANVGGLDASLHQGFCMRDDCLHARWFRFALFSGCQGRGGNERCDGGLNIEITVICACPRPVSSNSSGCIKRHATQGRVHQKRHTCASPGLAVLSPPSSATSSMSHPAVSTSSSTGCSPSTGPCTFE